MKSAHDRSHRLTWGLLLVICGIVALLIATMPSKPSTSSTVVDSKQAGGATITRNDDHTQQSWEDRIASASKAGFASLFLGIVDLKDPSERARILALLVKRWIEQDLRGFVAFVDAAEVDGIVTGKIWNLLSPALMEVLPQLDDQAASNPLLQRLIMRLIAHLAEGDPQQALAWAQQWLPDDSRDQALAQIAPELARASPAAAIRILEIIHSPLRRVETINGIGEAFGRSDPEQALQWAAALANSAERPYAMGSVLAAMASAQPASAAAEFTRYRAEMSAAYAAQVEADRAILARNPANDVEGDLGNFEVRPSPVNPQLHLLNDAAVAIAEAWAGVDAAAALQWVDTLPEGRLRRDALENALASWATQNGAEAFAFYRSKSAATPEMAESIFRAWAMQDPAGASAAATSVDNQPIQVKAVSGVVTGWMDGDNDSTAVLRWIDGLPPGFARDAANTEIVAAISLDQPYQAWERARKIENPLQRKEAMETAFSAILASDRGTAQQVLDAARLQQGEVYGFQRMVDATVGTRK